MTSHSKRKRDMKKEDIFKRVAQAAQRYTGSDQKYYCPLCMVGFEYEAVVFGQLTLEHVPPKSVGGKEIILTCKNCNNSTGSTIDAAISARKNSEEMLNALSLELGEFFGHFKSQIGNESTNTTLEIQKKSETKSGTLQKLEQNASPDDFEELSGWLNEVTNTNIPLVVIREVPERNSPSSLAKAREHLDKLVDEGVPKGEEFVFQHRVSYNKKLARIGDLKTAYLAAFTIFGYRFILQPCLGAVRKQILSPNEDFFDDFVYDLIHQISDYELFAVDEPYRFLIAKLPLGSVILPYCNDDVEFYKEFSSKFADGSLKNITGKRYSWPKKPGMLFDFHAAPDEPIE